MQKVICDEDREREEGECAIKLILRTLIRFEAQPMIPLQ